MFELKLCFISSSLFPFAASLVISFLLGIRKFSLTVGALIGDTTWATFGPSCSGGRSLECKFLPHIPHALSFFSRCFCDWRVIFYLSLKFFHPGVLVAEVSGLCKTSAECLFALSAYEAIVCTPLHLSSLACRLLDPLLLFGYSFSIITKNINENHEKMM